MSTATRRKFARLSRLVCATAFFGVAFGSSPTRAQSDPAAIAPWQAPPNHRPWSPSVGQTSYAHDDAPEQSRAVAELGDGAPCDNCGANAACDGDACDFGFCAEGWTPWQRLAFRAEYLNWWSKSAALPPLATTSPPAENGIIGQPDTTILFGGSMAPGIQSGARLTLDYWFSPCHDAGLEVAYLFLGSKSVDFDQASDGTPLLARPYFNVRTAANDSIIVASPNMRTGELSISDTSDLASLEVLYREAVFQDCERQLDFVAGYRYGRLGETLAIDQATTFISEVDIYPQNTVLQVSDRFAAANEFNGAEIGFATKRHCCRWSFELLGKLALGNTRSRVNINGATSVIDPDQNAVTYSTGGMLALPTNSGAYQRNAFSAIPELGLTIGYDLTCRLKLTAGYTFLYWSQVARAGEQVDVNLNNTQFPPNTLAGLPSPQFRFLMTDYWAQGLNLGLDYRF